MKNSRQLSDKQRKEQAQRLVEDSSRADEQRYQQMAFLTTEGIMVHQDHIILDANRAFAEMVGSSNPDELIGKNVFETIPFTPEARQCILAHIESGVPGTSEIELRSADGASVSAEAGCTQITYLGHPAHLVTMRDITKRKQAEAKLTRQLERLNVLHTIDQAVASSMDLRKILTLLVQKIVEQIQVDACAVLLLNPQTKTLDFTAKQGFRTKALEFTHLQLGSGLAGQAAQNQQVVYIPDLGKIKNNPVLTQAISDENFVVYIGIPLVAKANLLGVLEIFHRSKLASDPDWVKFLEILANEAAIAIDHARLMSIAQQSYKETSALYQINQKLIATIDPQELMNDVVNLLKAKFGYHFVQIFVAEPKTGNIVMRAGSGELGARLKIEGYHLSAGDGIVGFTAETGRPFFTNNVEEVITFIRPPYLSDTKSELAVPIKIGSQFLGLLDIHQKAPGELTERDVQLVTAVADQLAVALQKASLYSELQEALRQEQATRFQLIHNEKLTVAGRLLASVSHELNNPIQAIQNALFLLKEDQGISSQGKLDLGIVLSETERMAVMLQRLRTTYQPVSAEDFRLVNLNEIIRDVGALVATHLRHNHVSFEFQPDSTAPIITGLEDQIRQVMLNLVMNSVEAMTAGGHLRIVTQFLESSHEVQITVSDTGPGFDTNILPNIFEAFVTNKERGTGLGLTITNEIILKHGGRIQAENSPQGGANIHIWLPVPDDGRDL